VGGATEQVTHGNNGLVYPAGDIQRLAKSILEVKKANVDGSMGSNARKSVVDRFSLEKMVSKFEQTFIAMARRKKGAPLGSRPLVAGELGENNSYEV
jgi:glycosyltransferase involved in cell wall biosynthesis